MPGKRRTSDQDTLARGPLDAERTVPLEVATTSVMGSLRSKHSIRGNLTLSGTEAPSRRLSKTSGKYLIIEEIARGGMGVVYKAFDNDIRRVVAMKVLAPEVSSTGQFVEKFIEEAQATGQLSHPHIVPIYDIGLTENGDVYYCMKYVEGMTLADVLSSLAEDPTKESEWSLVRLLQVFQQVLMGAYFAHEKGVIHRDLKPANIMLGSFGEVLITDWGLAYILGESSQVVTDRALAGSATPRVGRLGHSHVHVAGTGSGAYTGDRPTQRHLRSGRYPVRNPDA